jgi:hypothetical protein
MRKENFCGRKRFKDTLLERANQHDNTYQGQQHWAKMLIILSIQFELPNNGIGILNYRSKQQHSHHIDAQVTNQTSLSTILQE